MKTTRTQLLVAMVLALSFASVSQVEGSNFAVGPFAAGASAQASARCDNRSNNTHAKLQECVTTEGVREHQAALQAIADANGGNRAAGTPGYDQSAAYVAERLVAAGYDVTIQEYPIRLYHEIPPTILEQVAPTPVVYTDNVDFDLMAYSAPGDVTAPVSPVDLDLGLGNSSTSGCEVADFAGFPAGAIALIQRGTCTFQLKAENAEAAGAVGAIIFNQGNTDDRLSLFGGTLGPAYTGNLPVVATTYALGEEFATTPGIVARLAANTIREDTTSVNVLAESVYGDASNVVIAGARLDSAIVSPGINENGSGVATLLEVAELMGKVKTFNKVRFAFWGSASQEPRGSEYYVLNLTPTEIENIAMYLNFDIIGSPNYVRFVYDGDGSDFGTPGPDGSAAIETLFTDFYAAQGLASEPTSPRFADGQIFGVVGIPYGGIYTGSFEIKTPEQAATYGGSAGEQLDPCSLLACDTFDNVSLEVLELNAKAVAFAVLQYGMNTEAVNGVEGKGNFKR
jgi:Zn-dependent M28 family amino/carboxypeptidase